MNLRKLNYENQLKESLLNLKRKIRIVGNSNAIEINVMLQRTLNECPEIFYVNEFKIKSYKGYSEVFPQYFFSKKEITELSEACKIQLNVIQSRLRGLEKYDVLKQLHDILVRNVKYSNENNFVMHTIVGPLLYRKAVCDGFARLYKYILNLLDIECLKIDGKGFNGTLGVSENHSWNMVKLYNNWYFVDVTYDATLSELPFIRYDYFLISQKSIMCDHYFDRTNVPYASDDSLSIYDNKTIIEDKQQMHQYIQKLIGLKQKEFVVKVSPAMEKEKAQKMICDVLFSEMMLAGLEGNIYTSFNEARNIIFVKICMGR